MDGEAGWWTTSGNIGLPPLARAMGVGRQQQHVELSSNEFVIMSPGSTQLSFPVSVGSLSINGRTIEDRDVISGGKLVVA